jgi:hypothetical protein
MMKNYYFVFNSLFLDARFCIVKESDMKELIENKEDLLSEISVF